MELSLPLMYQRNLKTILYNRVPPLSDPEVSEGEGVGDWTVSRGPCVYSVDQGDGRLVPCYPGRESLQRAADAACQTSSSQLLI